MIGHISVNQRFKYTGRENQEICETWKENQEICETWRENQEICETWKENQEICETSIKKPANSNQDIICEIINGIQKIGETNAHSQDTAIDGS